jgi:hypothetical protein
VLPRRTRASEEWPFDAAQTETADRGARRFRVQGELGTEAPCV